MCSKFRTGSISKLVGYTYPTLHKGERWFVDFFALDPVSNGMKRKRYYIGNGLKVSEKKRRAAEIIETLTKQLMQGWNPGQLDCSLIRVSCHKQMMGLFLSFISTKSC